VVTTASTRFVEDGNPRLFEDLRIGDAVEVKGTASGDTITASRVELEDRVGNPGPNPGPGPGPDPNPNPGPNPGPDPAPRAEVDIRGLVANLSGTATRFEFTLNGVTVTGDASTELENDADDDDGADLDTPASFADLANGVEVHVKGTQIAAGSILAREIEIEDEADDDDDDEARVRGRGVRFTTSPSTRFDDGCSSFRAGDSVEIRGRRNGDGSIAATRMRKR
jgi:hypothetical protein